MTCPGPFIDAGVAERQQLSALALHLDSTALRFTRAGTITQTQDAGELRAMIASRCKRMAFRSNEARKRYLVVHRALAGDA